MQHVGPPPSRIGRANGTIATVDKNTASSRLKPNLRITLFTSLATQPAPAGVKAMLYDSIKPAPLLPGPCARSRKRRVYPKIRCCRASAT